jgi:hypothetical protein
VHPKPEVAGEESAAGPGAFQKCFYHLPSPNGWPGMSMAREMLLFVTVLLLWLGMAYGIHRLAHWRAPWNLLHRLHAAHHQPVYLCRARRLRWHHFLLCFGSVSETLDIWFTLTLPLLAISLVLPVQGAILLAFHYLYEIFCSDAQLDHNPSLSGPLTRVFA